MTVEKIYPSMQGRSFNPFESQIRVVTAKLAQCEQDSLVQNVIAQIFNMELKQIEAERLPPSNIVHLQLNELEDDFGQLREEYQQLFIENKKLLEDFSALNIVFSRLRIEQCQLKKDFELISQKQADLMEAFKATSKAQERINQELEEIGQMQQQIGQEQERIEENQKRIRRDQKFFRKEVANLNQSFKEMKAHVDILIEKFIPAQTDENLTDEELAEKAAINRELITQNFMVKLQEEIEQEYQEKEALDLLNVSQANGQQAYSSAIKDESPENPAAVLNENEQEIPLPTLPSLQGWANPFKTFADLFKQGYNSLKHTAKKTNDFACKSSFLIAMASASFFVIFAGMV
jgi:chromosome segregation ATPase